jgi:hypothetical protein
MGAHAALTHPLRAHLPRFALTLYVHRVGSVRKKTVSAHPLRCPLLKERASGGFCLSSPFSLGEKGWG